MASSNPRPKRWDEQINPRYTVQRGDEFTTLRRGGPVNAACDVYRDLSPRRGWEVIDDRTTIVNGIATVTRLDP